MADRCIAVLLGYFGSEELPPFKVIAEFSDHGRESAPFLGRSSSPGAADWEISVQDTALAVTVSGHDTQALYHFHLGSFSQRFVLAIAVELLVAAGILSGWLRLRGRSLLMGLGYVLLANLVSYPVTWIVLPSLGQFQPIALRHTGAFIALIAAVLTAVLVNLSRKEGKQRRRWLVPTFILLPLSVICTLLCMHVTGVGRKHRIAVPGLPPNLTIAFAEAFAVSFEALIFYLLARETLALLAKQAAIINLCANMSSFLAGLILNIWL